MLVIYADNHLLAVRKPAGVPTVPDESGDDSALEWSKRWVAAEYNKPGAVFLGVVHRLDRPVSGVVLFARTSKAAARLSEAFRSGSVEKHYWAVIPGRLTHAQGQVDQWLLKDRRLNRVTVVQEGTEGAKRALTTWHVLTSDSTKVLVELRPRSGRPHQLRVAMASTQRALAGDLKYGAKRALPDRSVALHALSLHVKHPTRDCHMTFRAAAPKLDVWSFDHARAVATECLEVPD